MRIFVDTSVWSLALRRNQPPDIPEVQLLAKALQGSSDVYTTGLVLQELLQGFSGPDNREAIVSQLAALPLVVPEVKDYVAAAALRNACRRKGIQIGTIDALIAQLSIRFELALLTTDNDFRHMARHVHLRLAIEK